MPKRSELSIAAAALAVLGAAVFARLGVAATWGAAAVVALLAVVSPAIRPAAPDRTFSDRNGG